MKAAIDGMVDKEPVFICDRLIHRISKRDWGLPTLRVPGKIWRNSESTLITCMLSDATDAEKVRIETRPLQSVYDDMKQSMPDEWRAAIWEYVQAWPASGCKLGPLLKITDKERNDFLRKLIATCVGADDIGLRLAAHNVGLFASVDFYTDW